MQFLYVMDPMCSWCWAFDRSLGELKNTYPDIPIHYLFGGLAPDTDEPMPRVLQEKIQATWQHIHATTGTPFNHDFWRTNTPKRSTWRACRAAILAEASGLSTEQMVTAIQKAYYCQARNPSERATLIDLCQQLGGNTSLFTAKLDTQEIHSLHAQHRKRANQLGATGFPALFIEHGNKIYPLTYGYTTANVLITQVKQYIKQP